MAKDFDFKGLAADLLNQANSLLPSWLPDGRYEGKEWVATNPTRGDSKPGSFKVCSHTGKWSDFAVGEAGADLISLYAYLRGLKQGEAFKELSGGDAGDLKYTRNKDNDRPAAFKEIVEPVAVPEDAGEMPKPKGQPPKARYSDPETGEQLYPVTVYKDYSGKPVYRVVTSRNRETGNKFPLPTSYCRYVREQKKWDDAAKTHVKTGKILDDVGWHQKDWPNNIPLCGENYLFSRPEAPVLVVEGEKAWASAIERLPDFAAVTWRGGTNRVSSTNWSALVGRKVIICPDYDEPGQKAALKIASILKKQKNDIRICWEPLSLGVHEPGWDIADEEDVESLKLFLKTVPATLSVVEDSIRTENRKESTGDDVGDGALDLIADQALATLEAQNELRCLGYGADNKCFFICRQRGVVIPLSSNQMASLDYLLALMPLQFWYDLFPLKKGNGFNKHDCADTLQRWADIKGYFNPDVVRGAGVWVEKDGSHVLHMGQKLLVDKQIYNINQYPSEYMYEATNSLGIHQVKPLSTDDSQKLVDVCESLSWEKPIYAKLLAGFVAIAPMCGGLEWRPHIWVTGKSGSGKSTVISKIVHKICGKMSLFVQGESSAAGIRQRLGSDALPVIFDEFEAENQKRLDEVQKTLDLARQASSETGALMLKGSAHGDAVEFKVRSCFAFSSINVNIQHFADESRITVLTLADPRLKSLTAEEKQERIDKFTEFEKYIRDTFTEDYINALQIRSFYSLPTIKKNARIFGDAVQKLLGSARFGDQLGILCAGAYSLQNTGLVDPQAAADWVKKQDWALSTPTDDSHDHDECLSKMLQYILRPQDEKHYINRSIGELISSVFAQEIGCDEFDMELRRYGFKVDVEQGVVFIANNHSKLKEIMINSPYQTWHRLLMRIEGAEACGPTRFSSGTQSRAVSIPRDVILKGAPERKDAEF